MREKANVFAAKWKEDKLKGSLEVCWAACLFFSFFGDTILSFAVPGVGEIFPFRVFLPVSAVLYALYAAREKEHIWRDSSSVERWCYILIAVMLVYGAASLPRALDFGYTFRRLFNLCFDLCLFFLLLRLCRDEGMRRLSLTVCGAAVVLVCAMGVYEVFFGGIFNPVYDQYQRFYFFKGLYQFPIVASGNTNDYASTLMFCAAPFLLAAAARWKEAGRKTYWLIAGGAAVLYFLVSASSARLAMAGFCLYFAAFTVFLLVSDRRRLWIPLATLVLIGGVWFLHQYRYIVPSIQEYIAQVEEYRKQDQVNQPGQTAPPKTPPKLEIKTEPSQTLDEEFFDTNAETGEKELRDTGSGGVRVRLLLHAFRCFRESYGLGVGLGNTETLAPRRNVIPKWADKPQNSIHCFVARIAADYGVFVLIPLCAAALLLLKAALDALRRRERRLTALALLYFLVLLAYPFLSTASSDSQDIPAMWIYLAAVALAPRLLFEEAASPAEKTEDPKNA